MKRLLAGLVTAVALSFAVTAPTQASEFRFGDDENLVPLVDVEVVGAEGEALMLGYKTTTHNFFLPWSMSDDGYVLVQKDGGKTYYPMTADEIAGWQQEGVLPDPFPAYEIPLLDRIFGYLAWPTLAIIFGALGLGAVLKRRRQQKAEATAAAA